MWVIHVVIGGTGGALKIKFDSSFWDNGARNEKVSGYLNVSKTSITQIDLNRYVGDTTITGSVSLYGVNTA